MVDRMNQALEENNATHLCMPLKLDSSADVELLEWEPDLRANVYRVSYQTLPGRGRFFGYVQVLSDDDNGGRKTFKMISTKMPRLNSTACRRIAPATPM
ncbi:hypothetical protein AAVH_14570 [Aphelenchoides avenae]|nr:hypothetical protein AAVH_14570 [Aphelenchus avenae]